MTRVASFRRRVISKRQRSRNVEGPEPVRSAGSGHSVNARQSSGNALFGYFHTKARERCSPMIRIRMRRLPPI